MNDSKIFIVRFTRFIVCIGTSVVGISTYHSRCLVIFINVTTIAVAFSLTLFLFGWNCVMLTLVTGYRSLILNADRMIHDGWCWFHCVSRHIRSLSVRWTEWSIHGGNALNPIYIFCVRISFPIFFI